MTTGEKIAKIRKEQGLTQEEFGELLNVTRQSVSKWESDLSFPETDKLILIAKHFNCSLDYLLNNEINKGIVSDNEKKKILNGSLINAIALISYAVLKLILYFLPIAKLKSQILGPMPWYDDYYILANFYNFLFSSNYDIGNLLFLVHFFCTIITLAIGVLLLFFKDKRLYKANMIVTIISTLVVLTIFVLIVFISSLSFGLIILPLVNITYFVLLIIYRKKKYAKSV